MTDRLEKIFALIPNCDTFADIGCDHGYIANAMLKQGKAKKVIIADISAKCLEKAEQLLKESIENGSAISVVSNGFDKVPENDVSLIAGMGGEEICDIILHAKTLFTKNSVYFAMFLCYTISVSTGKGRPGLMKIHTFAGVFPPGTAIQGLTCGNRLPVFPALFSRRHRKEFLVWLKN